MALPRMQRRLLLLGALPAAFLLTLLAVGAYHLYWPLDCDRCETLARDIGVPEGGELVSASETRHLRTVGWAMRYEYPPESNVTALTLQVAAEARAEGWTLHEPSIAWTNATAPDGTGDRVPVLQGFLSGKRPGYTLGVQVGRYQTDWDLSPSPDPSRSISLHISIVPSSP